MNKAVRILLGLCALGLTAGAVAACGGVPGNAVAEVDGTPIDKADFSHWMNVVAKSGGADAVTPDPPDFAKCVAAKRKKTPKPAKGQPKTTDDQLKKQCQDEYDQLRDSTVSFLVSLKWIEGEAAARGIKVTDADVKKEFEQQKKQNFQKEKDYKKFLESSGMTEQDVLLRVRADLLSQKIRDSVIKGKDKVTDAQVKDFYEKNQSRFTQPETRDLRVVLTKTEAQADEAKRAIENGASWKDVAKRYSIDDASKANGGKLPAQAKGTLEKALDSEVFAADADKLLGPVKTQFGWYVFTVTKINPEKTQSLEDATDTIKQTLATQSQQNALNRFLEDFRKSWREKTECREGYTTSDCKNGPKPTPTPTSTAGGTGEQ